MEPLKICSPVLVKWKHADTIGQFSESVQNEIRFRELNGLVLEKVCQYLHYKTFYANATSDIPEFKVEPELALELLMAADFLDC